MSHARSLRRIAPTALLASLISIGLVALAACSTESDSSTGAAEPSISMYEQEATATDGGVAFEALTATFTGTETLVTVRTEREDDSLLREAVGDEVTGIRVASDGFEGPFADGSLAVEHGPDGTMHLSMPPLEPQQDYVGTVPLAITALELTTRDGDVRYEGHWELALSGPPADEVATLLWREVLAGPPIVIDGREFTVRGLRSMTETRIEMEIPAEATLLGAPSLLVEGATLMPTVVRPTADGIDARFPATPAGSPLTFDLGDLGFKEDAETISVTIDIAQALERADDGHGEFAILPEDIIAGNKDLVILGLRDSQQWRGPTGRGYPTNTETVGVRLKGSWRPVSAENPTMAHVYTSPQIFDQDGNWLSLSTVITGYSKDEQGNVHPGVSDFEVFVPDIDALETLTFVMGPSTTVSHGPYRTELTTIE